MNKLAAILGYKAAFNAFSSHPEGDGYEPPIRGTADDPSFIGPTNPGSDLHTSRQEMSDLSGYMSHQPDQLMAGGDPIGPPTPAGYKPPQQSLMDEMGGMGGMPGVAGRVGGGALGLAAGSMLGPDEKKHPVLHRLAQLLGTGAGVAAGPMLTQLGERAFKHGNDHLDRKGQPKPSHPDFDKKLYKELKHKGVRFSDKPKFADDGMSQGSSSGLATGAPASAPGGGGMMGTAGASMGAGMAGAGAATAGMGGMPVTGPQSFSGSLPAGLGFMAGMG